MTRHCWLAPAVRAAVKVVVVVLALGVATIASGAAGETEVERLDRLAATAHRTAVCNAVSVAQIVGAFTNAELRGQANAAAEAAKSAPGEVDTLLRAAASGTCDSCTPDDYGVFGSVWAEVGALLPEPGVTARLNASSAALAAIVRRSPLLDEPARNAVRALTDRSLAAVEETLQRLRTALALGQAPRAARAMAGADEPQCACVEADIFAYVAGAISIVLRLVDVVFKFIGLLVNLVSIVTEIFGRLLGEDAQMVASALLVSAGNNLVSGASAGGVWDILRDGILGVLRTVNVYRCGSTFAYNAGF